MSLDFEGPEAQDAAALADAVCVDMSAFLNVTNLPFKKESNTFSCGHVSEFVTHLLPCIHRRTLVPLTEGLQTCGIVGMISMKPGLQRRPDLPPGWIPPMVCDLTLKNRHHNKMLVCLARSSTCGSLGPPACVILYISTRIDECIPLRLQTQTFVLFIFIHTF